jgi:hypothetical protein
MPQSRSTSPFNFLILAFDDLSFISLGLDAHVAARERATHDSVSRLMTKSTLDGTTVAYIGASHVQMAQVGASTYSMATTDEIAAIVSPCLGGLLLIIVPDENDDRLRVIDGALEARIWNGKQGWVYEIASVRSGVVLAKGEASSAHAAVERSIPLLLLLHEDSGVLRCAA